MVVERQRNIRATLPYIYNVKFVLLLFVSFSIPFTLHTILSAISLYLSLSLYTVIRFDSPSAHHPQCLYIFDFRSISFCTVWVLCSGRYTVNCIFCPVCPFALFHSFIWFSFFVCYPLGRSHLLCDFSLRTDDGMKLSPRTKSKKKLCIFTIAHSWWRHTQTHTIYHIQTHTTNGVPSTLFLYFPCRRRCCPRRCRHCRHTKFFCRIYGYYHRIEWNSCTIHNSWIISDSLLVWKRCITHAYIGNRELIEEKTPTRDTRRTTKTTTTTKSMGNGERNKCEKSLKL